MSSNGITAAAAAAAAASVSASAHNINNSIVKIKQREKRINLD